MKNASLCIIFCILLAVLLLALQELSPPKQEIKIEYSATISVYNHKSDTVSEMPLEEYVWRCMAREMPASFHEEALKAQAVAIRSYTCCKADKEIPEHKGASVCTDSTHCAAFLMDEGELDEQTKNIYKEAANATKGQILIYEGEAATTVFHAMSSGKTENAQDVWGGNVPYLISVDSAVDTKVEGYESTAAFTWEELFSTLNIHEKSLGTIQKTEGGSVAEITIGGKTFKGTQIRTLLHLRSAAFTVTQTDNGLLFTVHGYGHGVGMSQQGANAYANEGMSYMEILQKYYPGTSIAQIL